MSTLFDQPATRGLDRLAAKNDPKSKLSGMGAGSPLSKDYYGGSAGSSYRRQEEAYGRALRQLRRASRRGDTGAALQEIRLRDEATERGMQTGVRDREERISGARGYKSSLLEAADRRRKSLELGDLMGQEERDYFEEQAQERRDRLDDGEPEGRVGDTAAFGEGADDTGMDTVARNRYQSPLSQPAKPLGAPDYEQRTLQRTTQGAGRGTPFKRGSLLSRRLV